MSEPFSVRLTKAQAEMLVEALEEKLAREPGDELRIAIIYSIESVLSSGVAHSKEK